MNHTIQYLFYQWKGSYFIEPFLIGTALASFIAIFKQPRNYKRQLFLIYVGSLFSLFIIVDIIYCVNSPWITRLRLWEIIDTAFEFIQAWIFIKFYSTLISDSRYLKLTTLITVVLFIFSLANIFYLFGAGNKEIHSLRPISSSVFLFGLVVAPIFYFNEVLRTDKPLEINTAFLSIALVAYCIVSSISFGIISSFKRTPYNFIYNYAVALHNLMLIVLCIILARYQKAKQPSFAM
jgi:hypothetical protein